MPEARPQDAIVNRGRLLYMFEEAGEARERALLHDINILAVLDAVMSACAEDEAILYKLNRRAVSGAILPQRRRGPPPGGECGGGKRAKTSAGGDDGTIELE